MHNGNQLLQKEQFLLEMTLDLKQPILYFLYLIPQPQHWEFSFLSTGLMIFPCFNISAAERFFGITEEAILFAVLTGNTTLCEITVFRIFLRSEFDPSEKRMVLAQRRIYQRLSNFPGNELCRHVWYFPVLPHYIWRTKTHVDPDSHTSCCFLLVPH